VPQGSVPGSWQPSTYGFFKDVIGNSGVRVPPGGMPTLTVTNTPPDTAAPQLSEFDFSPRSVDVNGGGKEVVTARVTDATGVEAPRLVLSSDDTTQTEGFGAMTRVSGTVPTPSTRRP
jgi:hypothetical protein